VKLNAISEVLSGKRVVVVDDSLVRGTTSRKIVKMIRQAGAKEVHMRISSPPIISPCFYGIDISTHAELIAVSKTLPEIEKALNADRVCYQRIEGLPDIPTFKESGYPISITSSYTLCAPKGTPKEIIDALSIAQKKAIEALAHGAATVMTPVAARGLPASSPEAYLVRETPEQFAAAVAEDSAPG
jgi:hypothetical protein